MIQLKKVGHVALRVPDPQQAAQFYTENLGLTVSARAEGAVFLRCGTDHHDTVFYPLASSSPWDAGISQEPGLHHIAFAVASREALERAAEFLHSRGVRILAGPGACEEPGVEAVLRFLDPEERCVELYYGMEQLHEPPASPCPFRPKRLSHFNLFCRDWEASSRFYTELLGMQVSDWIKDCGVFLRCAPDYHSLALMQTGRSGIYHFMYQVEDHDTLLRAAQMLRERGVRIVRGPGRHGPGRALFLYCKDVAGNVFELGCEEQQIHARDHWTPRVFTMEEARVDLWQAPVPQALLQ